MSAIQEVFNRMNEIKKRMKDIREMYKSALNSTPDYAATIDQLKVLREKKKHMEERVKQDLQAELQRLEDLSVDLASDAELLSDLALTQYLKGETVVVEDEYGNKYDPAFKVNFKKQ